MSALLPLLLLCLPHVSLGVPGIHVSLKNKRTILRRFFREGMLSNIQGHHAHWSYIPEQAVERNPKAPWNTQFHEYLTDVPALHVKVIMQSMVSKGYAVKVFCWERNYYTITDTGVEWVRNFLELPEDALPYTHKKRFDIGFFDVEKRHIELKPHDIVTGDRIDTITVPPEFQDYLKIGIGPYAEKKEERELEDMAPEDVKPRREASTEEVVAETTNEDGDRVTYSVPDENKAAEDESSSEDEAFKSEEETAPVSSEKKEEAEEEEETAPVLFARRQNNHVHYLICAGSGVFVFSLLASVIGLRKYHSFLKQTSKRLQESWMRPQLEV